MLSKPIFLQPSAAMRMLFTTTTLLSPFLYLFVFVCLSSSYAFTQRVAAKNMIRCTERERLALLDFKQGLVDYHGVLSSWGSDDECCNWLGVHCNNNTGHVTMLDLNAHNLNSYLSVLKMENLEVLDLSQNQLSGEIPVGLARLNYLDVLDLLNNFLSGKIPTGTQLQSFKVSSYAGNIGLCGDPLPKCSANVPPQHNKIDDYQESDTFLDMGFYISMVLGFSLSFWGIMVTLVLKHSWRTAYYEFLNDVKDWLYVKVKIYLGRLQQKLKRTR